MSFPTWLADYRAAQHAAFMQHGVPVRGNERWKYADLGMLAQQKLTSVSGSAEVSRDTIASYRMHVDDAMLLVFIDGKFAPMHSDCELLPKGVVACSLRAALADHEALVKNAFNDDIAAGDYPFAALNSAVFTDGLFLHVAENIKLSQPLHVLMLSTGNEDAMIAPHHMLVLGENSEAELIHEYVGVDGGKYFTNAVMSITANANSKLHVTKIQHESDDALHMENFFINQRADSYVSMTNVTTGAVFSRDEVIVQLQEPGAECHANGFYHASRDGQYVDHHVDFKHAAPRTNSGMMYKGIADKRSRAVFNGSLYVKKDAQKMNAYQENHNLLLSGLAEVY